jgi:hypothetical protein
VIAVKLYALGRLAYSAGLILAPDPVAVAWLGDGATTTAGKVGLRGLAARDAALAAGILIAARRGRSPRPWLGLCALGDLADLVATLVAPADDLPVNSRAGTIALAGGSAVAGAVLAIRAR